MKYLNTYARTLKKELRGKSLLIALCLALTYILVSVYIANYSLIISTALGDHPFAYKQTVLLSLLTGSWGMFRPIETILLIVIALLMGINMALMGKTLRDMKSKKGVRLSFGGSSMLAVVSVGCPGCGISLLSVAGVSSSFLPFQGVPMQVASIILMVGSLVYILRKVSQPLACPTA